MEIRFNLEPENEADDKRDDKEKKRGGDGEDDGS